MDLQAGGDTVTALLYNTVKLVYSWSKIPLRLLQEDGFEDFAREVAISPAPTLGLVKLVESASLATAQSVEAAVLITLIASPALAGGHGLNECYKIVDGFPPSCAWLRRARSLAPYHHYHEHVRPD